MTQWDWNMLMAVPPEWDMLGDIQWWMMGPAPRKAPCDNVGQ
jgi:hypothetical protein